MLSKIQGLAILAALMAVFIGCQTQPTPPLAPLPHALKGGWIIYSWQADSEWRFALKPMTNALFTPSQIKAMDTATTGVDGIKAQLARLPRDEEVFWDLSDSPDFSAPPQAMIDEVGAFCEKQRLKLTTRRTF